MADKNIGKITQIVGAVLDIKFQDGNLPEINSAINITRQNGERLVVEVAQHLGDDTVRCIAMGPTDGLVRGMDAEATGAPISVPVGENMNQPHRLRNICLFTEKHLHLRSRLHLQRCWKQVSR